MKSITMTAYKRADYLTEVLDELRKCDGIGEYVLFPSLDDSPQHEDVAEIIRGIDFMECQPFFHQKRIGCSRNTYYALERGFKNSEFNIHIEDDTVIAKDALRVIEFCRENADEEVMGITAFSNFHFLKLEDVTEDDIYRIGRETTNFTAWCFCTWKNRWDMVYKPILNTWAGDHISWDSHISNVMTQRGIRCELKPYISRCQNIGLHNGTYLNDEAHFMRYHHVPKWINDYELNKEKQYEYVSGSDSI